MGDPCALVRRNAAGDFSVLAPLAAVAQDIVFDGVKLVKVPTCRCRMASSDLLNRRSTSGVWTYFERDETKHTRKICQKEEALSWEVIIIEPAHAKRYIMAATAV